MSDDFYGERRPRDCWRGLCGTGQKCAVIVPQVAFPSMIFADSNRGVNETCKPTPEASAIKGRWSACVQGHVNLAETDGRQWRNVIKEGPEMNPPSFEREHGNSKTKDPGVHISQRQNPIGSFYPSMVHANVNTTSPFSSGIIPRVDLQLSRNTVNWTHVMDTSSSTICDQRFAVEKNPSFVPLTTVHQASLSTDYKSPEHDYTRAMQQSGNFNAYPFRYKTGPYSPEGDLSTAVYPYPKNGGGVTQETFCTALKNDPIAWDNSGTRLHGVHYSWDVASANEKPARLLEAELYMEPNNEYSNSNLRDVLESVDFQLFRSSRSQSPNGVSSQASSRSASPQRRDRRQSDSYSSGSPHTHRRPSSSSCSSFSKRMKANKNTSVRKSAEKGSKNLQDLLLSTLDKGSKGSQSLLQKRCKKKTSHSSKSRSRSPLTPISQSRNNHLPGKSRNSSGSRSQSPRVSASLSRKRSPRKGDSQFYSSSLCRKRSSSRKTYRSSHGRSRKHYSSRQSSDSSQSSRSWHFSSSQSRSLTPHRKDSQSSRKQKSLSTSNHTLGSPESSDEDTTQTQFGVKVKFCKTSLDDKSIKDNIFRLFHKFGLVTNVKIIHSGSERFALVYFSRLHEQQAAIYRTNHVLFCGTSVSVSLWTEKEKEKEKDELHKQVPKAGLNQAVKFVADYDASSIFGENNIVLHPSSSRTLLISKLPKSIAPEKLETICEKYDNIVDFEVEQTPGESTCSALVEFTDIVGLVKAGKELNRQFFGIDGVQVGFAEMKPTNCLWVDGLPPSLPSTKLMAHFSQYGPIAKMLYDRILYRALILYKQRQDALFAVKQTKLRQVKIFGSWLMLDFASDRSQVAFCQTMQECGQDAGNFLHE